MGGYAWDVGFVGWEVTPQPWQSHTPLSDEQPGGTTHLAAGLISRRSSVVCSE
jgi:hypothetical protein